MAEFDVLVDDSSPLIVYSPAGAWTDLANTDASVASYSGRSAHLSSVQGATATIKFHGTGLAVFGARRPGYGQFEIFVDGQVNTNDTAASDQDLFNQRLGEARGLVNGFHTAVFTNIGGSTIDIDHVLVHAELSSGGTVQNSTIGDRDPRIVYTPPNVWNSSNAATFSQGTTRFTSAANAQVSLEFSGDAIALYGSVTPDHPDMEVQIDGQVQIVPMESGRVANFHPQSLLYFASNLGPAKHTVSVKSRNSSASRRFWDLDSAVIFSATNTTDTSSINNAGSNSASRRRNIGIYVGVGVTLGLLLVAALAILFFLFRRRRRGQSGRGDPVSPITPALPLQNPFESRSPLVSNKYLTEKSAAPAGRITSTTRIMLPPNGPLPQPPSSVALPNLVSNNQDRSRPVRVPTRPTQRPPLLKLDTYV